MKKISGVKRERERKREEKVEVSQLLLTYSNAINDDEAMTTMEQNEWKNRFSRALELISFLVPARERDEQ